MSSLTNVVQCACSVQLCMQCVNKNKFKKKRFQFCDKCGQSSSDLILQTDHQWQSVPRKIWRFRFQLKILEFNYYLWVSIWLLSKFRGVGGINRERLAWFFRRFFVVRHLFSIEQVKNLEIFFLNVIKVDLTHNRKSLGV